MIGLKSVYAIFVVAGAVCVILGAVLFPLTDYIIRNEIKKKVIIANSSTSDSWEIWQDNPIPIYMQFYLFNVENPQQVVQGQKPNLTQKGPYTYRERRVKFDIGWSENGTVMYRQNRLFHFISEMSVGPESDRVVTLNPLLASLAQALKYLPSTIRYVVSSVLSLSGAEGAFIDRTVHDTIWGYEDSTLATLNSLLPGVFTETRIGYFIRRNNTDDGLYSIFTGAADVDNLCTINEYNHRKSVDVWSTPWANKVNGTDGSCGPPFVFDQTKIQVFQSDICRSLNAVYQKEVETPQGISLRRYAADRYDLMNTSVNPDNLGFCIPQTNCLPSGVLNLTLCEPPLNGIRIPALASLPHFLYAEPWVVDSVVGMRPDEREHETTIDIEPWTGFTMQISKKLQINFFVEKVAGVSQLQNISRLYFPIFWLNESVVIDEEHADKVIDELLMPLRIMEGARIGLFVLGSIGIVSGIILYLRNRWRILYTPVKQACLLDDTKDNYFTVTYGSSNHGSNHGSYSGSVLKSPGTT